MWTFAGLHPVRQDHELTPHVVYGTNSVVSVGEGLYGSIIYAGFVVKMIGSAVAGPTTNDALYANEVYVLECSILGNYGPVMFEVTPCQRGRGPAIRLECANHFLGHASPGDDEEQHT